MHVCMYGFNCLIKFLYWQKVEFHCSTIITWLFLAHNVKWVWYQWPAENGCSDLHPVSDPSWPLHTTGATDRGDKAEWPYLSLTCFPCLLWWFPHNWHLLFSLLNDLQLDQSLHNKKNTKGHQCSDSSAAGIKTAGNIKKTTVRSFILCFSVLVEKRTLN